MECFYQWYKDHNAVVTDPNVILSKSDLADPSSGYGLYALPDITDEGKSTKDRENDEGILLRIPKNAAFDINTIDAIIHDADMYTTPAQSERTLGKVKEAFKHLMENPKTEEFLSEATILAFYFLLFHFIKEDYEIPALFRQYLDNVLVVTEINNPITRPHEYIPLYRQYPTLLGDELVILYFTSYLENELGIDIEKSEKTIRQIYAAITSRTLEIPHEISEESNDFTTSTTLVPILDFINHSSEMPWCAFDVDRKSADIILKYKNLEPFRNNNNKQELFIQYSDIIEFTSFNFTYGFVPVVPDTSVCYFNLSLQRSLLDKRTRLYYKWFNINPVIQFYKEGIHGKWKINLTHEKFIELLLPFMKDSHIDEQGSWLYNPNAYNTFAEYHSKLDPDENIEDLRTLYRSNIRADEHSAGDIMHFPQLAWSLRYSEGERNVLKKRVSKSEAIDYIKELPEDDLEDTFEAFKKFLTEYANYRDQVIVKFVESIISVEDKDQKAGRQSFLDLCQVERAVLGNIQDIQVKMILEETTKSLDNVPLPPPINVSLDEEEEDIAPEFSEGDSNTNGDEPYDEDNFTDFLDEEYSMLSLFFNR